MAVNCLETGGNIAESTAAKKPFRKEIQTNFDTCSCWQVADLANLQTLRPESPAGIVPLWQDLILTHRNVDTG